MRFLISMVLLAVAGTPVAAQTHARHTAAHDSAHAIVLTDEQHLALHQFLLGRWAGMAAHGSAHDSLQLRFENDSSHQQLMVRHGGGRAGFEIRSDTLRWKQDVGGTACLASTSVPALLQAANAKSKSGEIRGMLACGASQSAFTLKKVGS